MKYYFGLAYEKGCFSGDFRSYAAGNYWSAFAAAVTSECAGGKFQHQSASDIKTH